MIKTKTDQILEKYSLGTLTLKEILENKETLEESSYYWIDYKNPDKMRTLIKTIEKDPSFSFLEEKIKSTGPHSIGKKIDESLRSEILKLDDFNKFVAMGYVAAKKGIVNSLVNERVTILDFTKDNEERNYGSADYRISSWHQGNYRQIAETFGLENRLSSWDGETAVNNPLTNNWNLEWEDIFDNYLKDKGIISKDFKKNKKNIELIVKIAEELNKKGVDENEMKNYIGNKNLIKDYESLKGIIDAEYKNPKIGIATKLTESYEPVNDPPMEKPLNEGYINSSEDAKAWSIIQQTRFSENRDKATKTYYSGFKVYKDGNLILQRTMNSPYFIYEDFPGGQSTHNDKMRIERINSVTLDNNLIIKYEDGTGEVIEESFKK